MSEEPNNQEIDYDITKTALFRSLNEETQKDNNIEEDEKNIKTEVNKENTSKEDDIKLEDKKSSIIPKSKKNDDNKDIGKAEPKEEQNLDNQQSEHNYKKRFDDIYPKYSNLVRVVSEMKKNIPALIQNKIPELLNGTDATSDEITSSLLTDVNNIISKSNINVDVQEHDNTDPKVTEFFKKFEIDLQYYAKHNKGFNNLLEDAQKSFEEFCNISTPERINIETNVLMDLYENSPDEAIEYVKNLINYMEPVIKAGGAYDFRIKQEQIINDLNDKLKNKDTEIEKYKEKIKELKNNVDETHKKVKNLSNSVDGFDITDNRRMPAMLKD